MTEKLGTSLNEARQQIRNAIRQNGPYSHNIVSLVLSGVASEHGTATANELIKEFSLVKIYGIHPVKEELKSELKSVPVVEKKVEEPKKTPYERRRAEANEVLRKVYKELLGLPKDTTQPVDYVIEKHPYHEDATQIRVQVYPEDHKSYNKKLRIYADLRGNGYYSHTDYKIYIRIESDSYSISFKKNWTPQTKELAKKVHAKIAEFVKQIKNEYESRVQQGVTEKAVKEKMAVEFPEAETVYVTGSRATLYLKEGKTAYNSNYDTYSIELEGLTQNQLHRILKIKQETKND